MFHLNTQVYMKKIIRRALLLILSIGGIAPMNAEQQATTDDPTTYDFEADGIYYKIMVDAEVHDGPYLEVSSRLTEDEQLTSWNLNFYKGDIVIPDSVFVEQLNRRLPVKTIRPLAFCNMEESLYSVTLPPTLTKIGELAFFNCTYLKSIDMHSTQVRVIPKSMCSKCFSLSRISMPEGLTEIGELAFFNCFFRNDLTIPESVIRIGGFAFADNMFLTSFRMSKSLKRIESSALGGYELEHIEWRSDSLEYIGSCPFNTKDSVIVLPKTIRYIGMNLDATDLRELICKADDPALIELEDDAFSLIDTEACSLFVPAESVELYRNAPQWCEFSHIAPIEQSGTDSVEHDNGVSVSASEGVLTVSSSSAASVSVYDVNGRRATGGTVCGKADYRVSPGIYLVTVGNSRCFKISVK